MPRDTGILDRFAQTPPQHRPRDRRRLRIVLVFLTVCLLLSVGVVGGGAWLLERHLVAQIHTVPGVFTGLTNRPVKPRIGLAASATNILFVGTDRRSTAPTTGTRAGAPEWVYGAQRSDTLMLVHISGDRKNVTVVSIPRDSWVPIPGHGTAKINAAFSWGGPSLLVKTVEELTGVRVDHLAVVDWDGFKRLTDALGGVDVFVPKTVYDPARHYTWTAGVHHLDGAQALLYVRQREGLPAGDLNRVQRQQYLLRLLLHKAFATNVWTNPIRRYRTLAAVTENLSTDAGWTIHQIEHLAHQVSGLPLDDFYFTTAPVAGTGQAGGQDVVFLATAADHALWHALSVDRAPAWFAQHPTSRLPTTVD